MKNIPNKIIVHHTVDASNGFQIKNVNQWHKERNFPLSRSGWYVGYHFFIEKTGKIIQCRQFDEEGAHVKGENFTSIGIGLAGNFDIENPTALQIQSMTRLIDELIKILPITKYTIYPHRHFANTGCYGLKLNNDWAAEQYNIFLNNKILTILITLKGLYEKLIQLLWSNQKHSN